jgi:H+/Cl- antiporter ClcA
VSAPDRPQYRPMTRRHKAVFAGAAAAALVLAAIVAYARFWLVAWWLGNCDAPTTACRAAEIGVAWWWLMFVPLVLGLAFVAHHVTRDRLELDASPSTAPGDG